ncbi:MAG TPA: hypothetical protein PLE74_06245 [Candidatus Cloacimonadota bacterium]|nr:hypothetical protein [Candidatus Cloacimonadota bacterium]
MLISSDMGRKSDFAIALPEIKNRVESLDIKAFSKLFLYRLFEQERKTWNISSSKKSKQFIDFILKENILLEHELRDQDGKSHLIFSKGILDDLTLFASLHPNGYFTHYTSMFLHQLTLQIPKTYYLNVEHSKDIPSQGLTQDAIDNAFSQTQRKANNSLTYNTKKVYILNGKKTEGLGVIPRKSKSESYKYTDLERTLIDIAIRPVYSGGVFEVLGAYKAAEKQLDPVKLESYLTQLNFIYPYHQVIGFYLEKAGYDAKTLRLFEKDQKFKFYLTYNIRSKEFSSKWNLYYPKGI